MTMVHDLLVEPLLSWRDAERHRAKTTLPGMLSELASGALIDFPRLRTHQFHPWSMFLTQLAAIALRRAGLSDPRLPETRWRDLLLALTDGAHEPWALVVDDLSLPAFLQPPVPEKTIQTANWKCHETPDDIDVLVTAKAHDVKNGQIRADDPEPWIYALTTLQTMQGVYGQGKYGIARMNKGYGSRPRVSMSNGHLPATRFSRDVAVLLGSWDDLLDRGFQEIGLALVWMAPWDGGASLAMHQLSPHFIEVCRKVRCHRVGSHICCSDTTTRVKRCLGEVEGGDVGDPWIPVDRSGSALSVGARGFHYELLTKLLFEEDFAPSRAQTLRPNDGEYLLFSAAALARGQGKTEGLHEREIRVGGQVRRRFANKEQHAAIGRRATERVIRTALMRSKVLFPALKRIAMGDTVVEDHLTERVDAIFFDHLFATLDMAEDDARLAYDALLRDTAWSELQDAIRRSCLPHARRLKAISEAESVFRTSTRKHFADLLESEAQQKGASA